MEAFMYTRGLGREPFDANVIEQQIAALLDAEERDGLGVAQIEFLGNAIFGTVQLAGGSC